jgi:2-polyprenyl-3-methyl-5-hydroxy-6-metoxy-1,4-benzoquinol methylase
MPARLRRYVPWRVMSWLNRHWPHAFHRLQYGISNINTAEHWDAAWRQHGHEGYRATGEDWAVRTRILAEVPDGARVLDVGCGVGELLALLHERRGCRCHGLDIAPAAIEAVRARGFVGEVAMLPTVPFADAAFDVVTCTEVLEHVSDARATLRELRRVLAPSGRVLVSVPDGAVDDDDAHVHRFTARRLERALRAHFRDVHVERLTDDEVPTLLASGRA